MSYTIRIKRCSSPASEPFYQEFVFDGGSELSVAGVLNELNSRVPLKDVNGNEAEPIAWECSCLVRKCGACAMRINGLPRLACSTFLNSLKGNVVTLEPLSKFPLVKDLIVDRSVIFENLRKASLWLQSDAHMKDKTHAARYQSAKCILCGCCLEICPNFVCDGSFTGAVAPVNAFRLLDEEQDAAHRRDVDKAYDRAYFEGCGKSLSCRDICPIGIPVDELVVRSNAAAIWHRH